MYLCIRIKPQFIIFFICNIKKKWDKTDWIHKRFAWQPLGFFFNMQNINIVHVYNIIKSLNSSLIISNRELSQISYDTLRCLGRLVSIVYFRKGLTVQRMYEINPTEGIKSYSLINSRRRWNFRLSPPQKCSISSIFQRYSNFYDFMNHF